MTATQHLPSVQHNSNPSLMFLQPSLPPSQTEEMPTDTCRKPFSQPAKKWGISILAPGEEMPAEVVAGRIYIGNHEQAHNRRMLQSIGVTHIVNASRNETNPFPDAFHYCNCGVADSAETDLSQVLEITYLFISTALEENPNHKVLVHCARGVSRSVAIVAGYLMRNFALSFHESIRQIRRTHPAAEPNCGFVAQLQAREKDWYQASQCAEHKIGKRRSSLPREFQRRNSKAHAKRLPLEPADGWMQARAE